MARRFLRALLMLSFATCAEAAVLPQLDRVAIDVSGTTETLRLDFDRPVAYRKLFRLTNPDRVVIDLPRLDAGRLAMPAGYRGTRVKTLRSGLFDPETTRLVVVLSGPLASVEGRQEGRRLVVRMTAGESAPAPSRSVPPVRPEAAAEALPLVVIDAGHGGKDPGAAGSLLPQEKNVTLRLARQVAGVLKASGRYRTLLTREDDRFILLGERVRIAQRAGAAVFISLHADTAPVPSAHGLSVYTVSETASDAEAQKLADQENNADLLSGFKVEVEDEEAAPILLELAQRDTKNKASQLADRLVQLLGRQGIHLLPQAHRFAGFRVLKAPDIPSVLIETGFLSNASDERLLASGEYPRQLAHGVLQGLDAYFRARRALAP